MATLVGRRRQVPAQRGRRIARQALPRGRDPRDLHAERRQGRLLGVSRRAPRQAQLAAEPADAIRALGPPVERRPERTYGGHRLGELLRFDWPTHSLHIQFRADQDGIDLVTAMLARHVPGRSHATLDRGR